MVLCCAVALALKVVRYAEPPPPLERRTTDAVTALLGRYGWTFDGWQNLVSDGSVRAALFSLEGCPRATSVAVLAGGMEVGNVALAALGPEAILIPAAPGAEGRPLIAVAPAPGSGFSSGPCARPARTVWQTLEPLPAPPSHTARLLTRLGFR